MTVQKKIDAYLEARSVYDNIHKLSQEAHQKMKSMEYELVDEMLNTGVSSQGMDDGLSIHLRKQYNCSVTQQNEEQVREWLIETEGDDSQFVVEKVNKPALLEWMKDKGLEPDDAPEFLKLSTRPGLTVRGWNKREEK